MGIVLNKNSMNGLAMDNKKIGGMAYKGDIIFSSNSIRTFADATDKEIAAMLDAHYAGLINIEDYWSVGDERVVQLTNLGSSGYKTHVDQKMTMVIIGFNHDDLKEQIGIRDKAAITVQCRECLGNNGELEGEYYLGENRSAVYNDNWLNNKMRTWFNEKFILAMPSILENLVKTVTKINLEQHSDIYRDCRSEDKAFLLSFPEVFSNNGFNDVGYTGSYVNEGQQYEYYKIVENRIKYPNNNSEKGESSISWWLRSPSSIYDSYNFYYWCCVEKGGLASRAGRSQLGLAPAFCL